MATPLTVMFWILSLRASDASEPFSSSRFGVGLSPRNCLKFSWNPSCPLACCLLVTVLSVSVGLAPSLHPQQPPGLCWVLQPMQPPLLRLLLQLVLRRPLRPGR